MKLNRILLAFLLLTYTILADTNSSQNIKENNVNNTTIKAKQNKEILLLKKRVKALESELKKYTQVKPVTRKSLLVDKRTLRKSKTLHGHKYVIKDTAPEKVSAYFIASYQTVYELKSKLEKNGFDILSTEEIYKNRFVITISNEELRKTNSFISTLHILVNNSKEIRVQNPDYFASAYLQENYKYGDFNKTMTSLVTVLGDMYTMKMKISLKDLASFNFMFGMPGFEDTIILKKSSNILTKLDPNKVSNYISYTLKLPNGSALVGHKLKKSTYNFFKKINAEDYAQMFPYEVMVDDKKAYMMHPKYYIPLSLPLLGMTDFMKIASAPVEIIKDIIKVYK